MYSDLEGHAIPIEVIRGMRRVEGVSSRKWQKRGVEVGSDAWQILIDWMFVNELLPMKYQGDLSGTSLKSDNWISEIRC